MVDLFIFGLEFEKNIVIFSNQQPQICLIAKFFEKTKIPKLGTKNV